MLTAGTIIEGAFRLVREHPAAVAIWGLLYLGATIAMALAMRPVAEAQMAALGGDPGLAMAGMTSMMGRIFLLQFAFMILFMVLLTAAQRAVLRPAEQSFFYLRLGMDELRMIGLTLLMLIAFYIAFVIAGLVVAIAIGAIGVVAGAGAAGVLGVILFLGLLGAGIWLHVRLSLVYPLTLARRKIIIGESWRLTRGRFWTLFGGYAAILAILLVLFIVVGLVTTGSYWLEMVRNAGDAEGMQEAMQAQLAQQFGSINAMTVIGWILTAAVGALTIALFGGSVASAARALIADESVADTFA